MAYDAQLAGKIAHVNGEYQLSRTGSGYASSGKGDIGVFTGNVNGYAYEIKPFAAYYPGTWWLQGSIQVKNARSYSRSSAQSLLDKILKDHKYIMQNCMVGALGLQALKQSGQISGEELAARKAQIVQLYSRLKLRELYMEDDGLIESSASSHDKTAAIAGADALAAIASEAGVSGIAGIGAIPVAVYYIVSAVVAVAVGAYVYYKLNDLKEAADYDLRLSNEFMKWFNSQSAEAQSIVIEQLKRTGDSAYRQALSDNKGEGLFAGMTSALKWGLIGFGAFFLFQNIDLNEAKKRFYKS